MHWPISAPEQLLKLKKIRPMLQHRTDRIMVKMSYLNHKPIISHTASLAKEGTPINE